MSTSGRDLGDLVLVIGPDDDPAEVVVARPNDHAVHVRRRLLDEGAAILSRQADALGPLVPLLAFLEAALLRSLRLVMLLLLLLLLSFEAIIIIRGCYFRHRRIRSSL